MAKEAITAYSTPDYDMPFNPFDDYWSVNDWIDWHKAMKAEFGLEEANKKVIAAWEDMSAWNWSYSFWKYNRDFVDYFNSQGLEVGHTLSRIINTAADTAENITAGLPAVGKILVPLAVVGIGAYAYNTFIK